MKTTIASRTAILPAIARAAHQILDGDPKVCADPLAVGLIEGTNAEEILASAATWRSPLNTLLRSVFLQRARYTEDCLQQSTNDGVRQFVVLGAGYDTFAYRQPSWARKLTIFEVDHPATQRAKLQRLAEKQIELPSNLVYCPVDFETQTLATRLVEVGYSLALPTYFSCLGVSQYLTPDAMNSLLTFVCSMPKGSGMVLTFVVPDPLLDGDDLELVSSGRRAGREYGEDWISIFTPQELVAKLEQCGFAQVHHCAPDEAQQTYFHGRSDGLRAPCCEQLISARV